MHSSSGWRVERMSWRGFRGDKDGFLFEPNERISKGFFVCIRRYKKEHLVGGFLCTRALYD